MEELLILSKFKLQLGALISSLKQSREKERYATEQYNLLLQKQNDTEEKYSGKLKELQAELATSNDLRRKLETKLNYLQNDNELLDNKQKELQGTISRLLQSKESFVKVYEDSTFEMKQAITHKDKTISALTEKINLHMSLFSSIEKEALSVKQIVENAQQVLSEKEELFSVAGLKIKVDRATTLGTEFMDKISMLDAKLRSNEDELRRKNKVILNLESHLEAANFNDKGPGAEEELKETLLAKEDIIQNLISEKKALHFELSSLQVVIEKIQDFIRHMDEENKKAFSLMMARQVCVVDKVEGKHRSEQAMESIRENFPHLSDPPQSNCSQPESTVNILNISFAEAKENYRTSLNQLDSECSTTQPQTF